MEREGDAMILLRRVIGDALRARRQSQHRTLREVSTAANVSLGYLSEIERGQKEASSELLSAICDALGAQLSELLREVSHTVAAVEHKADLEQAALEQKAGLGAERTGVLIGAGGVPLTRAVATPEPTEFRTTATGIVLPPSAPAARTSRKITVDGDVAVSVRQNSPLKATLRTTRNVRSTKRGREVALSH
jgi:transcriptional regulator with XRE-family HTH domain